MSQSKAEKIAALLECHRGIARSSYRHIRHIADDRQLTMAGLPILKMLYVHGALSQHAIAENLCVSDAAVSRQIGVLVGKGFIEVRASDENRRISLIELTPSGRRLADEVKRTIEEYFVEVLDEMKEAEIDTIVAFSQRMLDKLNERHQNKEQ